MKYAQRKEAQVTGCERESKKDGKGKCEREWESLCLVLSREGQVFVGFSVEQEDY